MDKPKTYIGVDNDMNGGMTTIGKIIRDAWVFGIIPETETCAGWNLAGIDALLDKVNKQWDKYGCLVSHLPADLRERLGVVPRAEALRPLIDLWAAYAGDGPVPAPDTLPPPR